MSVAWVARHLTWWEKVVLAVIAGAVFSLGGWLGAPVVPHEVWGA